MGAGVGPGAGVVVGVGVAVGDMLSKTTWGVKKVRGHEEPSDYRSFVIK